MGRKQFETDRMLSAWNALGEKARWGGVGYAGRPHAPAEGTYCLEARGMGWTTLEDSGELARAGALSNLSPLIAAAIYEVGFALEAGPLSTWRN